MNPKELKCPQCGLGFGHRSSLSRHKARCVHLLLFSCTVCLKSYKRRDNLKRHIQTSRYCTKEVDKEKALSCSVCDKGPFRDKYNRIRHERQVHGIGTSMILIGARQNIPSVNDEDLSDSNAQDASDVIDSTPMEVDPMDTDIQSDHVERDSNITAGGVTKNMLTTEEVEDYVADYNRYYLNEE